jgi:hypothetical protein
MQCWCDGGVDGVMGIVTIDLEDVQDDEDDAAGDDDDAIVVIVGSSDAVENLLKIEMRHVLYSKHLKSLFCMVCNTNMAVFTICSNMTWDEDVDADDA